jgi:uncharacterized phiE125 gp8 family phage protein
MTLRIVTPPDSEVLMIGEVKQYLRVEDNSQDALIHGLIRSVRRQLDGPHSPLKRALMTQTWDYILDELGYTEGEGWLNTGQWWRKRQPGTEDRIVLPLAPLQGVTSIQYYDTDEVLQTWSSSNYRVVGIGGESPGYITPAPSVSWPSTQSVAEAVTIRFTAGYGDPNEVPDPIRDAMLRLIAHRYENRELGSNVSWNELPDVADLLWPYRVFA